MSWCAVDVRTPAAERDAVAAWLVERTGQAVLEREDGLLVGAADGAVTADAVLRELAVAFAGKVAASARVLPEVDWRLRWRDGLGPRRVGRLLVTPSWCLPELPADAGSAVVILDPETAFGTAEHGSTRTALALLDQVVQRGDRVLDLGSGSGILAIAAARLGASRAIGLDLDPEVEPVARANAQRNAVADRVRFLTGDAREVTRLLGPAELIVANILRSVNETLLPAIRAALVPGGTAVFAGMEQVERASFLLALEREGWQVWHEAADDSWWGAAARPR